MGASTHEPPRLALHYSSVNEDSASERRALALRPTDRVLVVTGGGARVLDLVLDGPADVTAVDSNPAQGYLLELLLAATKTLLPAGIPGFLGVRQAPGDRSGAGGREARRATYDRLRPLLGAGAQAFWDARARLVERGVLRAGRWERFFALATAPVRTRARTARLLGCRTVEEQAACWRREWDTPIVRAAVSVACSRACTRFVLRDEAFHRYVAPDLRVGRWIMDRLAAAASRDLFARSPFARILFGGGLAADGPLPAWLEPEGLRRLSSAETRVRIVAQDLVEHLSECPDATYDAFSLSDVGSYLSPERHDVLWRQIVRTARPGARVCERLFLARHRLPDDVARCLERDEVLERDLGLRDGSYFYDFLIARPGQKP